MNVKEANRSGRNRGERGQTLVEYVLIISGMAVVLIAGLVLLQTGVNDYYQTIIDFMEAFAGG